MSMQQTQRKPQRRRRPRDQKGSYRLAVFFLDHRQPTGQAYYFNSTIRQDQNRTAKSRLKYLIDKKWQGKVSWAGLYHHNQLIEEFKIGENQWLDASKTAKLP